MEKVALQFGCGLCVSAVNCCLETIGALKNYSLLIYRSQKAVYYSV
jgi:hypothetical protein